MYAYLLIKFFLQIDTVYQGAYSNIDTHLDIQNVNINCCTSMIFL